MKKIIEFFEGIPMTIMSGLFIAASLILSIFDKKSPIDPAWGTVIISGIPLLYSAIRKLIFNKGLSRISSALLITIAMIAAIATKEVFAAGEVAFIMSIGEILEDFTTRRACRGLKKLIDLVPVKGRLVEGENEKIIDAQYIKTGDVLRVLPGEKIPSDGILIKGNSSVDQSIITGESLPVDKEIGDNVYCGTINRFGAFDMEVTQAGEDSSLCRLISMVEEARKKKAPTHKTADKWASILVPVALVIAIIAGLIKGNIQVAVTVLVVFCPCALVLATPTAIIAAIGQATKCGIVIKSGEALENLGKIDTVAFDKTGTLTYGKLTVSDLVVFENSISDNELLSIAASCESLSEHPLGKAIVAYAQEHNVKFSQSVDDFTMEAGKGVKCVIDGHKYLCGNERLLVDNNITLTKDEITCITAIKDQGKAIIVVSRENVKLGVIALSDTVRDNAPNVINQLNNMGINTVLLTGDSKRAANHISSLVNICSVEAELLPEDKAEAIHKMRSDGKHVCMIGDGVNDAPALKNSDVGVAMGTIGSDITIDAADVALINDNIEHLPYLMRLSKATIKTIKFSIALSLFINFAAIILSFFELLNPVLGALVHNAGSIFVILIAALLYDRKFDR